MNEYAPWRTDPHLRERFHPDYPDDLQVLVHEGGPRFTDAAPELMWVKVVGQVAPAYRGTLLNAPQNLRTLALGSEILFVAPEGINYPMRVTEQYLQERPAWHIEPCNQCGFPELFDVPSALMRKAFPTLGADQTIEMFTSFCPLCGGVQGVVSRDMDSDS